MNNKIKFLFVFFCLIIFAISYANALGITPGRTTLDFSSELNKKVDFTIINSEHKNMNIQVSVGGELGKYISLNEESLKMLSSEETRKASYEINLPQNLSPGLHTAEIVVMQLPEGSEKGRASVGAALAVATQVYVHVPYPGKYVKAELKVMGTENKKRFVIPLESLGNKEITDVEAEIYIYDLEGKELERLKTNKASLKSAEVKEIFAEWDVNISVGKYKAKAVLNYDGEELLLEKDFEIGEMVLDLQQIFVNDFKLGDIAKFNMIVKNKWNQQIENAYAEMRIYDDKMNEIDDLKSATYNIPAEMQTTINYYWDTENISKGLYNANIILYYSEKKTQQDLKLDVGSNTINVVGLGYVISSESKPNNSVVNLLFIIIGFLVLLNLLWFLVLRKYLTKRHKKIK